MPLDDEICYRAAAARDARFDGQFFTGVTSTGIFCRPVCPARTPGRDRCRFFPSAAAALDAGFRPCLRCRPEVSPDMPAWLGTSGTVSRALRLIHAGALDDGDVEALATRAGIGARHLRRLFEEHLGASPVAVAQARRLLFAKRLLRETELPLTDVAMAAGFGSLRRFNDLFLKTYGRSPGALRRGLREDGVAGSPAIELRLDYQPPYDWTGVAAFLARRALPGVEIATAESYSRTIRVGKQEAGRITVRPAPRGEAALLARIELPAVAALRETVERLHRVFDLRVAPHAVAAQLGEIAMPGIRIPGAWDVFELAVRAILGQQISVAAATTLATRMVERWGEAAPALSGEPNRLFPSPRVLADAPVAEIGLPAARATAITELARAANAGGLDLPPLAPLDEIVRRLCALRGIGEWTAQYIAMRAFGEPDAFPAGDLVLRKAMGGLTEKQLLAHAEAWRPWRAYAVFSLWQRS
ncbi:MAG: DNA-3-methyladenine glycosylase 2 family protein [Bryobacterales bacterium]|nr:DNA-3-methyladenine glycosylase 2 family protein [Bryobacterales bacterium]